MEALTPFFTPVCRDLAGKMFDATEFSNEVAELYGLRIPRLAVLGLAEQLERDGLLVSTQGQMSKLIYQYRAIQQVHPTEVPAVTEAEIDQVLTEFVAICRSDELLEGLDEQTLQGGFLDRLLNIDSMRLLSRKEGSAGIKRTGTFSLKVAAPNQREQKELRLDFHVAQFLLDLQSMRPELFTRVSDIAFASMAAEALACFSEPAEASAALTNFSVYLDSPLLLDVLGINADYAEYGQELLQMIKVAGAIPTVFDDCIVEAESVVAAQHTALRSGLVQRTSHWGSATPHVLSALRNNVGERASDKGIATQPDPRIDLLRRSKAAVGDIQELLTRSMASWQNQEARNHDERSVWSMLRIRNASTPCTKIRDSRAIFVARNTLLVRIANDAWRTWLQVGANHSKSIAKRWAPIAMSDKQLAGYLWLRNGAGNGKMSRARLLAHCSAAIRPRPDVKARAYNLVLDLHGKQEADIVAALLEDREGERALMRATRADPEDVTPQRLPYIIEQVKLAAGEFAAEHARKESLLAAEMKQREHESEIAFLQMEANSAAEKAVQESLAFARNLAQETLQREQLESRLLTMQEGIAEERRQKQQGEQRKLHQAFASARSLYRRLRGEVPVLFAALSLFALTSMNDWPSWLQTSCTLVLSLVGFWYIPDYLDGLIQRHALWFFRREVKRLDVAPLLHSEKPDFKNPVWADMRAN